MNKKFILTSLVILLLCMLMPAEALSPPIQGIFNSDRMDGKIVRFYPSGFNCSVNLKNDIAISGQKLHLYFMGTDNDFSLQEQKDGSYVIHTVPENFKQDFIIGTSSGSGEGEKVHLKSENSSHKVHNRWKILKNPDGTYKIKNLSTGLYMSLKNRSLDDDKNTVIQSGVPVNWEIICYNEPHNVPWMSYIDGNKLLSQINIPGTHDTGTRFVDGFPEQVSLCQCQSLTPSEQLSAGVRMFDLRCNARDNPEDPLITHTFPCYDGIADTMHFSEVTDSAEKFLKDHPSETVIFLVSLGSDITKQGEPKQLENIISEYISSGRIWSGTHVPKLEEVRGKIVLMRRFEVKGDNPFNISENSFGFDMTAWESGSTYAEVKGAVKLKTGCSAWIQDNYSCKASKKIDYFKGALTQASDSSLIPVSDFVFNYSSCTKTNPFSAARCMNKSILTENIMQNGKRYGIIPMDYVSYPLVRHIYMTNF